MRNTRNCLALLVGSALLIATTGCRTLTQPQCFTDWPEGTSPQAVSKRVAENFSERKLDFQTNPRRQFVIYPEICGWYGALTVAELIDDDALESKLIRKFDDVVLNSATNRISPSAHVDYRVFGVLPLEIYLHTKDRKYLALGQDLADKQWENTTPDGITSEARYWIDDMFMITLVQVQAFRATRDPKYLDHAALTMAAYLDRLQQTNGLFFHAPDSQFYWSRGNGWVAAGMAELLRSLPKKHPKYERVLAGYRTMMASLLRYQSDEGLWRQLLDHPESWLETSGTGMFAFSMVTGVKLGLLDEATYGLAARKAWLGLVKYLDPDANVKEVCVGTNKGPSVQYYLERERRSGDLHGQSPIMWTASALMR